jgi:hypothetical protein
MVKITLSIAVGNDQALKVGLYNEGKAGINWVRNSLRTIWLRVIGA